MSDADVTPVLVTPSAFELSPAEPESDEWFAQRRAGITATDIPKLLGLSPYGNARSVWHDKRGELPFEEAGEAARWGQILEPIVAAEYATRTGYFVHTIGTVANVDRPWMRASLDRVVYTPGVLGEMVGGLEVKTRSSYAASSWKADVPDDVLAQVVWQLLVSGLPWIDVAVLLGGQRLVVHRVTLEDEGIPEVAAMVMREAERVWGHVQDGTVPQVDHDQVLLDLLDRMYPDRTGQREMSGSTMGAAQVWLDEYQDARYTERIAKARATEAKAALVELLDGAETAINDQGQPLYSYKPVTRAGYTVAPTTYRSISLTRKKGKS